MPVLRKKSGPQGLSASARKRAADAKKAPAKKAVVKKAPAKKSAAEKPETNNVTSLPMKDKGLQTQMPSQTSRQYEDDDDAGQPEDNVVTLVTPVTETVADEATVYDDLLDAARNIPDKNGNKHPDFGQSKSGKDQDFLSRLARMVYNSPQEIWDTLSEPAKSWAEKQAENDAADLPIDAPSGFVSIHLPREKKIVIDPATGRGTLVVVRKGRAASTNPRKDRAPRPRNYDSPASISRRYILDNPGKNTATYLKELLELHPDMAEKPGEKTPAIKGNSINNMAYWLKGAIIDMKELWPDAEAFFAGHNW